MTIANSLALLVLDRLRNSSPAPLVARRDGDSVGANNIKRTHRVGVSRDNAPEVHVIDGNDLPRTVDTRNTENCISRLFEITVSLFMRDDYDDVYAEADPILEEIVRRIGPQAGPYLVVGAIATPKPKLGEVRKDVEIADGDAIRIDIQVRFSYETLGFGLSA